MPFFDAYRDDKQNDERAVLCHELGHAVAWFTQEGAVGSITVERETIESGVEADILLLPRDGKKTTEETEAYQIPSTVRLLAGDVAYRKEMGMPEGMISLRGFCAGHEYTLEAILEKLEEDNRRDDDLYKIVSKAFTTAPLEPEEWLDARLVEAVNCVNSNWKAISGIADRLEELLPIGGQKIWVPGTNIISWMKKAKVKPGKIPPLELIHDQDATNLKIAGLRSLRGLLGVHQVLRVH